MYISFVVVVVVVNMNVLFHFLCGLRVVIGDNHSHMEGSDDM